MVFSEQEYIRQTHMLLPHCAPVVEEDMNKYELDLEGEAITLGDFVNKTRVVMHSQSVVDELDTESLIKKLEDNNLHEYVPRIQNANISYTQEFNFLVHDQKTIGIGIHETVQNSFPHLLNSRDIIQMPKLLLIGSSIVNGFGIAGLTNLPDHETTLNRSYGILNEFLIEYNFREVKV
jgi:hypothetical protein